MEFADRFPVNDFNDALRWLWVYTSPEEWLWASGGELPEAAMLVCDLHWITPSALVERMRRDFNEVMGQEPRRPYRGKLKRLALRRGS